MPPTRSTLFPSDPWRALAWAGVLLIAVLLVQVTLARHPALIAAMVIFLAACLALQLFVRQLPGLLAFLLVLTALLSAAGGVFEWFEVVSWYDEAVHTFSGFAGMAAIGYLYQREGAARRAFLVTWCAGVGLLLGIGWEFIEGLIGDLEIVDTTTDLLFDTAGAALGGLFAWRLLQSRRRLPAAVPPRGAEASPSTARQ